MSGNTIKMKRDSWFPLGERKATSILKSVVPSIQRMILGHDDPSVTQIAMETRSPYRVLVSTVISARTKDEVTGEASRRLFAAAGDVRSVAALTESRIAKLIYPAGFYRTKARAIRTLSRKLIDEYDGSVPDTIEELVTLPGVGRKTANLVLTQGFNKPGICVDTHVHRVCNRLGVVETRNPEETEYALRHVLPRKHWIEINDLLVTFGRIHCTPISPHCSRCDVFRKCRRVGVARSR